MKQNFDAINRVLAAEDMQAINDLDTGDSCVDEDFWAVEGSSYTLANLWDG